MDKEKIVIEGYLTETKLIATLKRICEINNYEFIGEQVRLDSNRRMPYDCGFIVPDGVYCENGECLDVKYLVEFDGYFHYTSSKQQYNDSVKNHNAELEEYELVRIPYFIQLNNDTFPYYFPAVDNSKFDIVNDFPHGFIDHSCRVPADFNIIGIQRYQGELNSFYYRYQNVYDDVVKSVDEWVKRTKKDLKYVDTLKAIELDGGSLKTRNYFSVWLDTVLERLNSKEKWTPSNDPMLLVKAIRRAHYEDDILSFNQAIYLSKLIVGDDCQPIEIGYMSNTH
jgi:hypothetical protein